MMEPFPPEFLPGDAVDVVMGTTEFPTVHLKRWIGLFQFVGCPKPIFGKLTASKMKTFNDYLSSTVEIGDRCLVVAVQFCNSDKLWYYLLRVMDKKRGFGWTRSSYRLQKVF